MDRVKMYQQEIIHFEVERDPTRTWKNRKAWEIGYEFKIGNTKVIIHDHDGLKDTSEGMLVLNGNERMITGVRTASVIFDKLAEDALKEIQISRENLGRQSPDCVRVNRH